MTSRHDSAIHNISAEEFRRFIDSLATDPAFPEVESEDGGASDGLLITGDFPDITMHGIIWIQSRVRDLVLKSVSFEAYHLELTQRSFLPSALDTPSYRWGLANMAENSLRISGSVTVNPWQEVITTIAAAAGGGSFGVAIMRGLRNIPYLLDLGIRVSTLGLERENRKRELRNRAAELDDELLNRIAQEGDNAADDLLDAIAGVSHAAERGVNATIINEDEVAEFRRRALRVVRNEDA